MDGCDIIVKIAAFISYMKILEYLNSHCGAGKWEFLLHQIYD